MSPRLVDLVLALLADWWRRQWHNVLGFALFGVVLVLLCVFVEPFGGGL